MPSALPISNRRKPNYLITPSHYVQTELPVVDNTYLISQETGRINQGCREAAELDKDLALGLGFASRTPCRSVSRLATNQPQLNGMQAI